MDISEKNFGQNICSEIEIKAYFHFSCHGDESTSKTIFVEVNVMKFQLYPPYGF